MGKGAREREGRREEREGVRGGREGGRKGGKNEEIRRGEGERREADKISQEKRT